MKIRSITSFINPNQTFHEESLQSLRHLTREISTQLQDAGFEVESTRLAAPPLAEYLSEDINQWKKQIQTLERKIVEFGWTYFSAGSATPNQPKSYEIIPELIAATQNSFFNAVIADNKQVYPVAVKACSDIILKTSTLKENGFANLNFAALANVPPYAPFFPAAYCLSDAVPAFSIAIECADEAVRSFTSADSLSNASKSFIEALEQKAEEITKICVPQAEKLRIEFKGLDFSPAPFPEDWCSLGKAFELLGLDHVGGTGSLAAAAFIADCLDKGKWKKVGFNGLMMAVMEDSILAKRAAEGVLSIHDLLLFSAVCGTGLDTIPLPGDISAEALSGILLDLGALATRLGKPLTGRLMPIPKKTAGEITEFSFGYFANSRVMSLEGQKISAPLMGNEPIQLTPRKIPG